jgi:glycosyltransferase involved in cell wall biosynthesis
MKIGLDAKRVFNNPTGLGVYGRNLVTGLSAIDQKNHYILFTPNTKHALFDAKKLSSNFEVFMSKGTVSYIWRTFSIVKDIRAANLDIYHGLSNELPYKIKNSNTKNIVDIHDLCFVRYPSDYSVFDRNVFWQKTKRAAEFSDLIIATSEATKRDIVSYLKINPEKIRVIYQCCDKRFYVSRSIKDLNELREKYQLPRKYVLCVGTIQGRKNQQAIVKAMALLPTEEQVPIVLVGNGKKYLKDLQLLGKRMNVALRVIKNLGNEDLPGIYQLASIFIYPSFVEGFGIPVLEAMASKIPVISSKGTSMAEIIDDDGALIDPNKPQELADKIQEIFKQDSSLLEAKNFKRAETFSQERFAKEVLSIYEGLCKKKVET